MINLLFLILSFFVCLPAQATDYCMRFPSGTPVVCGSGGGITDGTIYGWQRVGTNTTLSHISDNVGIGTSTPQQKLDVEGTLYSTSEKFNGPILWSYDGDFENMGNTDASLFHIGGYAKNSGTLAGLINAAHGGSGDFSHLYFIHNVPTPSNGVFTTTDDPTSPSYIVSFSDIGWLDFFYAGAKGGAGAPTFGSNPTFSFNMNTGNLRVNGTLNSNNVASTYFCLPDCTTNGSWRFHSTSTTLDAEHLESGVWVYKGGFGT